MSDFSVQFTTNISVFSIALLLGLVATLVLYSKLNTRYQKLDKSLNQLKNEFRAVNSGQLGMGRKIRQVVEDISNNDKPATTSYSNNEKTYQQAGLLLARGATIEEVVDACDIAPAEAELIAIMKHAAPSIENTEFMGSPGFMGNNRSDNNSAKQTRHSNHQSSDYSNNHNHNHNHSSNSNHQKTNSLVA